MENGKKISVIVPIYKVERYLRECVDSILTQTYTNLEVILVDDGSPDNCPAICDEYAEKDVRVCVIHQKNSGLSAARNAGLEIFSGEYVAFIDSDDFIHQRYFELLMAACEQYDGDVCICSFKRVSNETVAKSCIWAELSDPSIMDCVDGRQANYRRFDGPMTCETITAWGKVFRRNLFENKRFPVNIPVHEDDALIYSILYETEKVVYISTALYFYRKNPESIIGSHHKKESWDKNLLALNGFDERAEFYRSHGENELFEKHMEWMIKTMVDWLCNISPEIKAPQQIQKILHDELWKAYRCMPFDKRVKYAFFALCPNSFYGLFAWTKYTIKTRFPGIFSKLKAAKANYLEGKNKFSR